MDKIKIAETVGFVMIIVAFLAYLGDVLDYTDRFADYYPLVGALGLLIWALAYGRREHLERGKKES